MPKCVAPGCTYEASVILIGMSLCQVHREDWLQVQLAYYRTLPKEQLRTYQAYMAEVTEEFLKERQAASVISEVAHRIPPFR